MGKNLQIEIKDDENYGKPTKILKLDLYKIITCDLSDELCQTLISAR